MNGIRRVVTAQLSRAEINSLRELLWEAFGDDDEAFGEHDWDHAQGGTHVLAEVDDLIVSHAAVVERDLEVAGRHLRTGYVEAVATRIGHQRRGYGSAVMLDVNEIIRDRFQLGALGTGVFAFYEPLGWERWRGPTAVRTANGVVRTPDEDGGILVLRTEATLDLNLDLPISCEWREGDVW